MGSVCAKIAHEVVLTHEVMQLWGEVLPGKVLHVHYEDLVANQARRRAPWLGCRACDSESGLGLHRLGTAWHWVGVEASHWAASCAWPVGSRALRRHTRVLCLVAEAHGQPCRSSLSSGQAANRQRGEQVDAKQDHAGLLS